MLFNPCDVPDVNSQIGTALKCLAVAPSGITGYCRYCENLPCNAVFEK